MDKQNVFCYNLNFFKVTCSIACTEIATPVKGKEYFLVPKALTQFPNASVNSLTLVKLKLT